MDDLAGGIDLGPVPAPLGVIAPGLHALGYTNPIYIDVDGDGAYDAPGTPIPD
jgi:hypothetical protein